MVLLQYLCKKMCDVLSLLSTVFWQIPNWLQLAVAGYKLFLVHLGDVALLSIYNLVQHPKYIICIAKFIIPFQFPVTFTGLMLSAHIKYQCFLSWFIQFQDTTLSTEMSFARSQTEWHKCVWMDTRAKCVYWSHNNTTFLDTQACRSLIYRSPDSISYLPTQACQDICHIIPSLSITEQTGNGPLPTIELWWGKPPDINRCDMRKVPGPWCFLLNTHKMHQLYNFEGDLMFCVDSIALTSLSMTKLTIKGGSNLGQGHWPLKLSETVLITTILKVIWSLGVKQSINHD